MGTLKLIRIGYECETITIVNIWMHQNLINNLNALEFPSIFFYLMSSSDFCCNYTFVATPILKECNLTDLCSKDVNWGVVRY